MTPKSRDITTFSCDSGIYKYKVLVMGITSAAEGQRLLQQILLRCSNCRNWSYDILIWGKNTEEHEKTLDTVLQTLKNNNLTIAQHKSVTRREVELHDFMVSDKGIKPSHLKIETVRNFVHPKTVQEVCSFLSLINYLTRFMPRLATLSKSLKKIDKSELQMESGGVFQTAERGSNI